MQQVARNEKSCSKTEKMIGKTLPSNLWKALREAHYLAAREGNAQSRNTCCLCQKTTKWRTELPEGICVSHSSFIGADFCRRGGGACHFRSSGKQTCKSIWIKQHWIIAWGYWPYVFAGWLSKYSIQWGILACAESAETDALPRSLREKHRLAASLSEWAKKTFLSYKKGIIYL